MKLTLDILVEDIVAEMKRTKEKFVLIEDFPKFLTELINKKYGKFNYTSEIGVALKRKLFSHKDIVMFKTNYNVHDSNGAFTISIGDYFAIRGAYLDVVDMKERNRIVPMMFKRRDDVLAWERGDIDMEKM